MQGYCEGLRKELCQEVEWEGVSVIQDFICANKCKGVLKASERS